MNARYGVMKFDHDAQRAYQKLDLRAFGLAIGPLECAVRSSEESGGVLGRALRGRVNALGRALASGDSTIWN